MKVRNIILLLATILLSLTSCQFTEKIYIYEDGTGTFDLEINLNEMIKSMNQEKDSTNTIPTVVKDTIIDFANILEEQKDSIAKLSNEERKKIEKLKNVKLRIREDKGKGKMIMNYLIDFKNIAELQNIENIIEDVQNIGKEEAKPIPSKTKASFVFSGNTFKRTVLNKELSEEDKAAYDESMKSATMFLQGSSYNIEYHFPKAIKSTTAKDATFSADKKIMYLKKTLKDVSTTPNILDFEVILE